MRSRASSPCRAAPGSRLRCVPARISSAARTARTSTSCARRQAGSRRAAPRVFSAPRARTEPASRSRRRTARAALTRRRSLPSSPDSASTCRILRPALSSTPAASTSAGSPRVDNFFTNQQRVTSIRLALEGGTGATGGEPVAVGCSSAVVQPLGREVRDVLTVDIALPDVEELHKLVAEGKEKGFLSYDEIVNGIEDVELTKEQVEDFYTYLVEHGVDLVEGEQHKAPPREQPP